MIRHLNRIRSNLLIEASSRISTKALRALLKGLYEIILDSRSSKGDIWRFRDLCITYCGYKDKNESTLSCCTKTE